MTAKCVWVGLIAHRDPLKIFYQSSAPRQAAARVLRASGCSHLSAKPARTTPSERGKRTFPSQCHLRLPPFLRSLRASERKLEHLSWGSQTLIQRTEAQRQQKRTRDLHGYHSRPVNCSLCWKWRNKRPPTHTHTHTKRTQIYGVCESAALCRALIAICQPAS